MATITRPFNFSLGSAYSGLSSTISYQVVVGGSVVVGPATATGITEGSFGAFTETGSYNVEIPNFDTSWVGRIVWYESTNEILYEEPFTATQSGDGYATVVNGVSLTANEHASIATAVLTDATGANQATPGSLGSMVGINNGIAVLGVVNDTNPSVGTFVISLATGTLPNDNRFVGQGLNFTGALSPAKAKITAYQLLTATTARVWFANPFGVLPVNGASFTIF